MYKHLSMSRSPSHQVRKKRKTCRTAEKKKKDHGKTEMSIKDHEEIEENRAERDATDSSNDDDENEFEKLKEFVRLEIRNCRPETELNAMIDIIIPESENLSYYRAKLQEELYRVLQPLKPTRVALFGSNAMGLGFKASSLDFYVGINDNEQDNKLILGNVANVMDQSGLFEKIDVFYGRPIPIIQCLHSQTLIKCNINVSFDVGLFTTKILSYLLTFDSRIYVLAVIIKFWMKSHNFIGQHMISSYDALWLLFFYLQQLENPILPPIEYFQNQIPRFYIGAANLAFQFGMDNPSTNNQRISTLLSGFFEFYDSFDFLSMVISPLSGQSYKRANFERGRSHLYYRYITHMPVRHMIIHNKSICMQDPFDVTCSIPHYISSVNFQKLQVAFSNSAKICKERLATSGATKNLLLDLFDSDKVLAQLPFGEEINQHLESNSVQVSSSYSSTSFSLTASYNELTMVKQYLQARKPSRKISDDVINEQWAKQCVSYMSLILCGIFGFRNRTNQSVLEFLPTDTEHSQSFSLVVSRDVFYKRRDSKHSIPNIKKEIKKTNIALRILKTNKMVKYYIKRLRIICRISTDIANKKVFIDFYDIENNPEIDIFYSKFRERGRSLFAACFMCVGPTCPVPKFYKICKEINSSEAVLRKNYYDESEDDIENENGNNSENENGDTNENSKIKLEINTKIAMLQNKRAVILGNLTSSHSVNHFSSDYENETFNNDSIFTGEDKEQWAEKCIGFIVNFMEDVLRINLKPKIVDNEVLRDSPYSKLFNITGALDITYRRPMAYMETLEHFDAEIKWSKACDSPLVKPYTGILHVWTHDYQCITVDFYCLTKKIIIPYIDERLTKFISMYFEREKLRLKEGDTYISTLSNNTSGDEQAKSPQPSTSNIDQSRASISPKEIKEKKSKSNVSLTKIIRPSDTDMFYIAMLAELPDNKSMDLKQVWAKKCIDFVICFMREILRFQLEDINDKDNDFSKQFKVSCLHRSFQRSRQKLNTHEQLESAIAFAKNHRKLLAKPLSAYLHVWSDGENNEFVSLNLYNLNQKVFNPFIKEKIDDFLSIYLKTFVINLMVPARWNTQHIPPEYFRMHEKDSPVEIQEPDRSINVRVRPYARTPKQPNQNDLNKINLKRKPIKLLVMSICRKMDALPSEFDATKSLLQAIDKCENPTDDRIIESWFDKCIIFVLKFVQEIMRFDIKPVVVPVDQLKGYTHFYAYEINATYDVTACRRKNRFFGMNELRKSINESKTTLRKLPEPLTGTLRISSRNSKTIFVQFNEMSQRKFNDFINQRIRNYVTAYFRAEVNEYVPFAHQIKSTTTEIDLIKNVLPSGNDFQQLWAQAAFEFIEYIFEELFLFKLRSMINDDPSVHDSEFNRKYEIYGEWDIADKQRKFIEPTNKDYIDQEIKWSKSRAKRLLKPIKGELHIWTCIGDFSFVSIDFYKLNQKRFNTFIQSRMKYLVSACFRKYINNDAPNRFKSHISDNL